jgi:hypothetical protein
MLRVPAFLLLLCSAALVRGDVKNDFDPEVDFSRFRTFTFVGGVDLAKNGFLSVPENRERVKNFISGVMELRGYREVPRDGKYDLAVRYWVARRDKSEVSTVYTTDPLLWGGYWGGYPPYWGGHWSWYYEEYVVRNYVEGTLIVDLIDPGTKELVWRTYLREQLDDPAKAYDKLKKSLTKGLEGLPPSASAKQKMKRHRAKNGG